MTKINWYTRSVHCSLWSQIDGCWRGCRFCGVDAIRRNAALRGKEADSEDAKLRYCPQQPLAILLPQYFSAWVERGKKAGHLKSGKPALQSFLFHLGTGSLAVWLNLSEPQHGEFLGILCTRFLLLYSKLPPILHPFIISVSVDQKSKHRVTGICSGNHRTEPEVWTSLWLKPGTQVHLPSSGWGQNSLPYGCSTVVLVFLLACGLQLLSALRSCLQFLAMWSPWTDHKVDVCISAGQMKHLSLISSFATSQRKVSAFNWLLCLVHAHMGNVPILRTTMPYNLHTGVKSIIFADLGFCRACMLLAEYLGDTIKFNLSKWYNLCENHYLLANTWHIMKSYTYIYIYICSM